MTLPKTLMEEKGLGLDNGTKEVISCPDDTAALTLVNKNSRLREVQLDNSLHHFCLLWRSTVVPQSEWLEAVPLVVSNASSGYSRLDLNLHLLCQLDLTFE